MTPAVKVRLKLAAVRSIWGGALLFFILNIPLVGGLVVILISPLLYLTPARFQQSGKDVGISAVGIELRSVEAAIVYWVACTLAAFAIGYLYGADSKKSPSKEGNGQT